MNCCAIVKPLATLKNWAEKDINKKNFEQAFKEAYGKNYDIDWRLYELDKSLVANLTFGLVGTKLASSSYRAKSNYYYLQALNIVKDPSEIKNGFQEVPEKEAVYHNYNSTTKKFFIGEDSNKKYVNYEKGKEAIIDKNGKLVTDPAIIGTFNYYTYNLMILKTLIKQNMEQI